MLTSAFSTSFIVPIKYFKYAKIELEPFYINERDINESIRYKACEALNINDETIYNFEYIRKNSFKFEIFAMDNRLKSLNKYLSLYCEPLLYKNLYLNKKLEISNDIFINIEPKNSFVTYYENGEHLFIKDINEFIERKIYDGMEQSSFEILLYKYSDDNIERLTKVLNPINEIITSIKNIYSVKNEKNVYINFNAETDEKIFLFLQSFIYKNIKALDINKDALIRDKNNKNTLNFSKKKNYKNVLVKSSSLLVASTILSLMYPLYLTYENYKIKKDVDSIKTEFENIDKSVKSLNKTLDTYNKQKKILTYALEKEKIANKELVDKIKAVYVQKSDKKKIKILVDITKDLNEYKLILDKFNINNIEDKVVVDLFIVSDSKYSLVSLIQNLSSKYKEANTDSISKENNAYKAVIKVVV
jgi:hypothetical protein